VTERTTQDGHEWLAPGEAAKIAGVNVKTLARYADAGLIQFTRLPVGPGHRRYLRTEAEAIRNGTLAGREPEPAASP
jgi:predicted site-specific integrase-resolvase